LFTALCSNAQLDTTQILKGDWEMIGSSIGFSYPYDSTNDYLEATEYNLSVSFKNKTVEFVSKIVFSSLHDSLVRSISYKYRRNKGYLVLNKKKEYRQLYIEKLGYYELVLTERTYDGLARQGVERRYFFNKVSRPDTLYTFLGEWVSHDTCGSCSFWKDTIILKPSDGHINAYGCVFTLSIEHAELPSVTNNSYTISSNCTPKPDTTNPYSKFESYCNTFGKTYKHPWSYNPEKGLIYLYSEFISDDHKTYRIEDCIPGEKLVLIKQP
jgi:hypothetical protein